MLRYPVRDSAPGVSHMADAKAAPAAKKTGGRGKMMIVAAAVVVLGGGGGFFSRPHPARARETSATPASVRWYLITPLLMTSPHERSPG